MPVEQRLRGAELRLAVIFDIARFASLRVVVAMNPEPPLELARSADGQLDAQSERACGPGDPDFGKSGGRRKAKRRHDREENPVPVHVARIMQTWGRTDSTLGRGKGGADADRHDRARADGGEHGP